MFTAHRYVVVERYEAFDLGEPVRWRSSALRIQRPRQLRGEFSGA